jgi:hypothetical protein
MADLFSQWDLGEGYALLTQSFKCGSAVTKGQLVVPTHVAGEYPTVAPAGANATNVIGVALASGASGECIPVMIVGIVKVTAASAIAAGSKIASAANGQVQAMPGTPAAGDEQKICGLALQGFASGDTGLILVGVV